MTSKDRSHKAQFIILLIVYALSTGCQQTNSVLSNSWELENIKNQPSKITTTLYEAGDEVRGNMLNFNVKSFSKDGFIISNETSAGKEMYKRDNKNRILSITNVQNGTSHTLRTFDYIGDSCIQHFTNLNGPGVFIEYYDANGLKTKSKYSNGKFNKYYYDNNRNLIREVRVGELDSTIIRNIYDPNNFRIKTIHPDAIWEYVRNTSGDIIREEYQGRLGRHTKVFTYKYDNFGNWIYCHEHRSSSILNENGLEYITIRNFEY